MAEISKLAVVHQSARIGNDVSIGPFCVIGPDVVIGDGCELVSNVTITGMTRIGKNNIFYQNVVIGTPPQDLKYNGAPTETIIGSGNVFRENCTVHRGTQLDKSKTVIGNNNLLMVAVHVAHDCILEDKILLGNQTLLAGHVRIEEGAVVSALVGLHHFVTVGKYSYVAGLTPVRRDVPPFTKFSGDPNVVRAVNEEGLRRNGFSDDDIKEIKQAFRNLFRHGNSITKNLEEMEKQGNTNQYVHCLCEFMQNSCQSRFGRFEEAKRQDSIEDRKRRPPEEVRRKV